MSYMTWMWGMWLRFGRTGPGVWVQLGDKYPALYSERQNNPRRRLGPVRFKWLHTLDQPSAVAGERGDRG